MSNRLTLEFSTVDRHGATVPVVDITGICTPCAQVVWHSLRRARLERNSPTACHVQLLRRFGLGPSEIERFVETAVADAEMTLEQLDRLGCGW